jgi:outer membrane biosynthesis protein TonB
LDAIRKWRFKPGMKDGQPVRTYIRVPMRFRVASS